MSHSGKAVLLASFMPFFRTRPMKTANIVVLVLLLAGCAETYGPAGTGRRMLLGGGYRDQQISKNAWKVEYSAADYDFAYRNAVRRSAEIANREGFPFFTVFKSVLEGKMVGNYTSGGMYVGSTVYVTLMMTGFSQYEGRCYGDKINGTTMRCDLYNTDKVLKGQP